jgi:cytochrome c
MKLYQHPEFKKPYERPVIEKQQKMTFPMELISVNGKRVVCRQCSACHGCR